MKIQPKKEAQTWSTDILIAVVLFIMIFVAFFYIVGIRSTSQVVEELRTESKMIPMKFMSSRTSPNVNETLVFILNNKVDKKKLRELSNLSYSELRTRLGIKHDFCLYFEDEYGNLINISDTTVDSVICIGSPNATLNDVPCG